MEGEQVDCSEDQSMNDLGRQLDDGSGGRLDDSGSRTDSLLDLVARHGDASAYSRLDRVDKG